MGFNVGPGVGERMEALHDHAVASSTWINIAGVTIEIGHGEKYVYFAHNLQGDWQFSERPSNSDADVRETVVNRIGTLPASGEYADVRSRALIRGITIHYTATPATTKLEDIAAGQLTRWANAAKTVKFPAIAYHLVVDGEGRVNLCHPLETVTWHSPPHNDSHVAICFIGNTTPSAAQLVGLKHAVAWVRGELGREVPIEGHRDAPYATDCPGPTWPTWKGAIE